MDPVKSAVSRDELRIAIGQKLMIDIRYFDDEDLSKSSENQLIGYQSSHCNRAGVTKLPTQLGRLLSQLNIGGVILFAENCQSKSQISALTQAIQHSASQSQAAIPALISIDQEGGRVTRLPKEKWPTFSGNMAIGATCDSSTEFAYENGLLIGEQLSELGINVNHSPTVDVNINHENPVINVRSFGDDPKMVGKLGIATAQGLKSQGILATFKHFPGHGDTQTDSHTGLPCVTHSKSLVESVDLMPFQEAIDAGQCELIMTAHIQYPALDDSIIINKHGQKMIRPATLSRTIITEKLRQEMGFNGLVITDALDMASISEFFTPLEAVLETFRAGVDIALMPFKVHHPDGIKRFYQLVDSLVEHIISDQALTSEVMASYRRILKIKMDIPQSTGVMDYEKHREFERRLALRSIINLSSHQTLDTAQIESCSIVMPNLEQALALKTGIEQQSAGCLDIHCLILPQLSGIKARPNHLVIIGIEDKRSVVDLGGMDDIDAMSQQAMEPLSVIDCLREHKELGAGSVFVSLKAPYHCQPYISAASISLASFDANCYQDNSGQWCGAAFYALAQILFSNVIATGKLPITID